MDLATATAKQYGRVSKQGGGCGVWRQGWEMAQIPYESAFGESCGKLEACWLPGVCGVLGRLVPPGDRLTAWGEAKLMRLRPDWKADEGGG